KYSVPRSTIKSTKVHNCGEEPTGVRYAGVPGMRRQEGGDNAMEGTGASHELLSVDEVASYLGVEPITVYRWCRQGRLPALKVGKAWRIRRGALDDFLRRSERGQSLVSRLNAFFTVPY